MRVLQHRQGILGPPGRVQRDAMDVGVARGLGRELCGPGERGDRLVQSLLPDPQQPERVVQGRRVGNPLQPLSKHPLPLGFPLPQVMQIRQVHVGRHEEGTDADRRFVLASRPIESPELAVQDAQVGMRLGSVGVDGLGCAVLRERCVQCSRVRKLRPRRCKRSRSIDANTASRVFEQRLERDPPQLQGQRLGGAHGRHPDQSLSIGESGAHTLEKRWLELPGQQLQRGGADDAG